MIQLIGSIQIQLDYTLGYRAMTRKLISMGYTINHKKVARIMRENNLNSVVRRKKYSPEVYARRKALKETVPANVLNRNFYSPIPRTIFVTDITYLYTSDGVYYLNIIEDLYNREVVAWKIGASPDSYLCIETVRLLSETVDLTDTIIHSDQGSSYTSYDYRDYLLSLGITQSCSDVGECWDNAAMESFNSILKTEGFYAKWTKKAFRACKIPSQDVFEQVGNFIRYYNNFRIKENLGYLSPARFLEKFPLGKE